MSVMAVEAAPAAGEAAGGSSAAGAAAGGLGGGQDRAAAKCVLLAIAIVLLWLAGLAFFIALEGSSFLGEQAKPTGGGFFKALVSGLNGLVQKQAGTSGTNVTAGG